MEESIKDAKKATAKARAYIREMLGHPYFETETIDAKQEAGHWIVQLEVVHLMRPERLKYKIEINAHNGVIDNVIKLEAST